MRLSPLRSITAGFLLTTLVACGGLGDRQIKTALEKSFGDAGVCWRLNEMEGVTFPIRTDFDPMAKQSNAVLAGLRQMGYIELGKAEGSNNPYGFFSRPLAVIDLTPKGKEAGVWDLQRGFCIGHKRVVEVTRFSEPAEQMGVQISQVEYKWAIKDTPSWMEPAAFSQIDGLREPVEAVAVLRKMSDGWQVVGP